MEYLYHYTSIENLALILKSGNIRFKSLDTVDDLNEGHTQDVDKYQQFVFVSCWTIDKKESIPIWNMYAKDMSGVRIALPKYPFNHYSLDDLPKEVSSEKPFKGSTIMNKLHFDNGFVFRQDEHYLVKVIYTDDLKLLQPRLIEKISENEMVVWSAKVGIHKEKVWKFQSEVRYRIIIHPKRGFKQAADDRFKYENDIISKYIDIPIRKDAFKEMKILLGPKQSDGNRIIVESLIEKYNPNIKIETSKLQIRH
jgi:hypothetical protein